MDGGGGEGLERELKFACSELNELRERLVAMGAERIAAPSLEDNAVFDREDELRENGRLLRLRRDGQGARLTYKGPARSDKGVKIREERETRVDDADAVDRILTNLGYAVVYRYQKRREEWRVGGVAIALDHTPIGDFVEFEGERAEKLAERFDFQPEVAERRNYIQLYREYRRQNPSAPENMIFSS